jgi:hypothetical protein
MQKKLNEDFIDSYCEKFVSKITDSFFSDDKIVITGKEMLKVTPSKQTNLFVMKLIFQYWQGESKKLKSPFFNYESDSVKQALLEFMNVLSQNIEVHKNRFQLLLNHAVKDAIYLAASPQTYLEIELDSLIENKIDDEVIEEIVKYLRIYQTHVKNFLSDMRGLAPEDAIDELDDEFEPFDATPGLTKETELLSQVLPIEPDQVLSEDFPEDFDEFDDDEFDNDEKEPNIPEEAANVTSEELEESEMYDHNEARFKTEEELSESLIEKEEVANEEKPSSKDSDSVMNWGDEIGEYTEEELAFLNAEDSFEPFFDKPSDQEQQPVEQSQGQESEIEVADSQVDEPEADINNDTIGSSEVEDVQETGDNEEEKAEAWLVSEEVEEEEKTETEEVEEEKAEPDEAKVEEKTESEVKEESESEEVEEESESKEAKEEPTTVNDQFEVGQTVAEHHEEQKANSMMELISVNHQYMFVKELFKDDQVSFQNALYELEEYNSFDDAVEFLVQGYAKEFEWDMQSNEVKELLKVLFRKYRD